MLSDEALYERLLGGDLSAFDRLYQRYERPLFGFIRKHLADVHEAEDVLHEAFVAVLRERDAGRSAQSFRAWIYQVARHLCLNRLRARKRAAKAVASVARAASRPEESPDLRLQQHEAARALRRGVERLPSPLGELYALRAGGLTYSEIAEALGVPLGTVKSRMHVLVSRLREEVKT